MTICFDNGHRCEDNIEKASFKCLIVRFIAKRHDKNSNNNDRKVIDSILPLIMSEESERENT